MYYHKLNISFKLLKLEQSFYFNRFQVHDRRRNFRGKLSWIFTKLNTNLITITISQLHCLVYVCFYSFKISTIRIKKIFPTSRLHWKVLSRLPEAILNGLQHFLLSSLHGLQEILRWVLTLTYLYWSVLSL